MRKLVSDHSVPMTQLAAAIQPVAMLNSEIERAMRRATDFRGNVLNEVIDGGKDEGCDLVRIRVTIEPITLAEYNEGFNKL